MNKREQEGMGVKKGEKNGRKREIEREREIVGGR